MNFLAICQRLRQECDVAGTGPSAVTGQTGELKRVVDWAASAWDEIQGKYPNWRWMRSRWSVNTVAGTDTYAATACTDTRLSASLARFKRWWPFDENGRSNVKIYLQSSGVGTERWISFLPWPNFLAIYRIGTQNNGVPAHFTIDPQNNLVLGPKPDGIYVVSGEYQMSKQSLAADGDTPEMPADYHMLVVYEGMKKYAGFEAAPEVYQRGAREGGVLWRQLELDQKPPPTLGEPLA